MNPQISKIIRTSRKTVALYIQKDGSLVVRAPFHIRNEEINQFVYKKRFWINQKRRLINERNRLRAQKEFVNGEGFLYLGEMYKLRIVNNDAPPLVFNGEFLFSKRYLTNAREVFIQWYKERAKEKVTERVDLYTFRAEEKYNKINITNSQHRWGSCGSKGNLNFSWRLVMAPLKVIDYVVVHEITHLTEKNHAKKFWRKVKILSPDYELNRKWLKENEHLLVV